MNQTKFAESTIENIQNQLPVFRISPRTRSMPPISFEDAIRRYDSSLRLEKNLSPRTRAAYAHDLGKFSEFLVTSCGKVPPLHAIAEEHVREFVVSLTTDRNYRPTTLSRTVSSVRSFFRFCAEQALIDSSPAAAIRNPRLPSRLPIYMVEDELRKLFAAPDVSEPMGLRDRAMIVLLAFCGLRLQELVGLNMTDVDVESRTLRIMGKGSKERLVPMNEEAHRSYLLWLQVRNSADKERAVFTNKFGRRLSGRMVEKIVDKYVLLSGVAKDKFSPHKLRHTFATMLHNRDVDLVEIQALLGHSSLATTQIYTHTHAERLRGAVEKIEHLDRG